MEIELSKKFRIKVIRKATQVISILIPILTLFYGIGDYSGWWDNLFGRSNALLGWERLASNEGYPKIFIFNDEPVFQDLYKTLCAYTKNREVFERKNKGILPTAIIRVGGTLKPDVGDKLPEDWPNPNIAPESLPIIYLYDYPRQKLLEEKGFDGKQAIPVGTLGDLRRWIEESRNQERFIVTTMILGILSIVIIILDWTKPDDEK